MANKITLQSEENPFPVDENLRPLKIGGKSTALELAQTDNGARIRGDLTVTGKSGSTVGTTAVAGPTNNYDVAGLSVLKLNTASNSVTIGGFTNGTAGQILFVFKPSGSNIAILEHNEGGGSQNIYLQSGADESIGVSGIKASNPMGGWILVCDGTHWYSIGK